MLLLLLLAHVVVKLNEVCMLLRLRAAGVTHGMV